MKSLEILKEGVDFMNRAIKVNPNSVKELQSEIDRYIEAIKELEELNSRSCGNCKFKPIEGEDENDIWGKYSKCSNCSNYYENKYEEKENK